uniref:ATP-binding cassette, sub-family C (CFTR/MRP), member 4 n=1 Tax=Mastacembelus armatus TaxID=205130 RepID=A0A7N9AYA3_9TELE
MLVLLHLPSACQETIKVIQPVVLGKMIQYFENYDPNNKAALYETLCYAAALSFCTIGLAMLHHLYFFHVQRAGMKIRVAMCHMIYKKALGLSSSAMGKTTTGQIVNLLSNDVNRFDDVTIFLHFLWVGPLQAAAVVGLLWVEIGPSCLAGMVVLMFLMPMQTLFGRLFSTYRSKTAVQTDSRIRTMNEFFTCALCRPRKEISKIMKSSYLRGLNMASFFCASKIILFITFTIYVLLGNTISASRVFVTVSLYTAVKLTVTLFFPSAIEKLFESRVSIRRIQEFLLLDEITKSSGARSQDQKDVAVEIQDLVCYWDKSLDAPSLQNVSLSLKSNQLLAVIGPVGAGKSSLLSSILGELPSEKGVLKVKGQLTYAAQQPWVFPGTIRSNILFGKELNAQKYERVIKACALKRLLPHGDQTLIGDRGATLSGGQKARVNLARAVYQDADIYLLDDPLSAVDAEVGRHLFEQCICGLLKNKSRILVTHQLQYLKTADQILVLKEVGACAQPDSTDIPYIPYPKLTLTTFLHLLTWLSLGNHLHKQICFEIACMSSRHSPVFCICSAEVCFVDPLWSLQAESAQVVAEESRAQGTIGPGLYVKYLRAGTNIVVLLLVMVVSLLRVTCMCNNLQLVFTGLTAVTIVLGFVRNLVLFNVLVRCAQSLHNRMFNAIIRTPVCFFDINPIGRVLNRFSKDIGQLDSNLPWTFVDFIQVFLQIVGVIAVAASVIPWILIPVLPLLLFFLYLRRYFLQTSRDIKRLESTTRSPVFSHLSSSLQGLWTIRAFGAENRFQKAFDAHQDLHSEAWFLFLTTSRWFALRLDGICSVFVTVTTFGCLLLRDQLDAGSVGLALTYSVTLIGMFQWGVRQSAEVENMMTSVERVVEYTELESEGPWETRQRPPPDWPSKGLVTFDQVDFSHTVDGPPVLRDVKVTFRPKEKVGIVGRTGAGKSSLIAALFRLAEPQGKIYIDSVLTSEIGLHDLRQKMSIIPQDPVLFTGSMRKNLDPFNQHTDEELWNSLQEVSETRPFWSSEIHAFIFCW